MAATPEKFDKEIIGQAHPKHNGGSQDIEVRFVRLIWLTEPLSDLVFSNGFE